MINRFISVTSLLVSVPVVYAKEPTIDISDLVPKEIKIVVSDNLTIKCSLIKENLTCFKTKGEK